MVYPSYPLARICYRPNAPAAARAWPPRRDASKVFGYWWREHEIHDSRDTCLRTQFSHRNGLHGAEETRASITELSPILFVINGAFYHSEHFCAHRLSRTVRRRGAPQATASGVGKLPRRCQTKFAEGWSKIVGQVQVSSIDSQSKSWAKSSNFVAKSFLKAQWSHQHPQVHHIIA